MDPTAALKLCEHWLPLWTGNRPEHLVQVYAEDVFYRDPAKPEGVRGKAALLEYFRKLLTTFPDWVWTAKEVFPIDGEVAPSRRSTASSVGSGFILRWKARIPVGSMIVHEAGMDLVLVENGLITRNEVYFDRAALLAAMKEQDRRK